MALGAYGLSTTCLRSAQVLPETLGLDPPSCGLGQQAGPGRRGPAPPGHPGRCARARSAALLLTVSLQGEGSVCFEEALSILATGLGTPPPLTPEGRLQPLHWVPVNAQLLPSLPSWVLESQLSLEWLRAVESSLVRAEVRIPHPVGCELPAGPGPASGSASLRGLPTGARPA